MTSAQTAFKALRALGPAPLIYYARYQLGLRSGWYRMRSPVSSWQNYSLDKHRRKGASADAAALFAGRSDGLGGSFFFDPYREISPSLHKTIGARADQLLGEADGILKGLFPLFGSEAVDLGYPVSWGRYPPIAGAAASEAVVLDRHWASYDVRTFPADIKLLWEPSRFGWVYTLARAYRLSAATVYFTGFVELLDSWRAANQPNSGPQWMSAQECALRIMAIVFAAFAFAPDLAERPEIKAGLAELLVVHAQRVELTLDYARAQGNNHLLVEALGLYSVGLTMPQLASADGWRNKGRQLLIEALKNQIFPDGGYVQHSTNYQRLALQAGLWATRLAEVLDEPLPEEAQQALRRLTLAFAALVDPETGRMPNFGPNDGAHILPLSTTPFGDARPTIQAAAVVLHGHPVLPPGPWDEMSIWLGMEEPLQHSPRPIEAVGQSFAMQDFPHEGLYVLHGPGSRAFFRSAYFDTRPGHSDQLHVDLWRREINVVLDAGSYLYQGSGPWQNALSSALAHNAILVDGREPMTMAGRFLWLDWTQARLLGRWCSAAGRIEVVAAQHDGYRSSEVRVQRSLIRADDIWMVVDEIFGHGDHSVQLHWLLVDGEFNLDDHELSVESPAGPYSVRVEGPGLSYSLIRAGKRLAGEALPRDVSTFGWRSPTYASLQPALSLLTTTLGALPLRISTLFTFDDDPSRLLVDWRVPAAGRVGFSSLTLDEERLDF